jgi:hypothetical protein
MCKKDKVIREQANGIKKQEFIQHSNANRDGGIIIIIVAIGEL